MTESTSVGLSHFWDVFWDAQQLQIGKWLLNYQLYAVVAGLLLLSAAFPIYCWTRRTSVGLAHDYFYGVVHTLLTFPILTIYAVILQSITSRWLPWIECDLLHGIPASAQIVLAIVVNDFLAFLSHYVRHKVRPLWHFHTIHHSQEQLNPFTTKRTHIVEQLFNRGVVKWIPLAMMGSTPEVWLIYYWYDAIWDYFVHSNLKLPWGPLKYVLVSPQYHRLHHSSLPKHFDKNFGDHFVIWDLIFGTASFDYEQAHPTGVPGTTFVQEQSLAPWKMAATFARQWWYPFRMLRTDYLQQRRNSRQ